MATKPIPEPTYKNEAKALVEYYNKARELVLINILNILEADNSNLLTTQASILRQIDFILNELDANVQLTIEENLIQSFKEGQALLSYQIGDYETLEEATENVFFSLLAKNTLDAIIQDTFDDLLTATKHTSKKLKSIVRKTVAEKMRVNTIQAIGRRQTKAEIVKELTRQGLSESINAEGFVGIVDKKGRKWELNRYIDLVVRVKNQQARAEGIRIEALESGNDLAIISSHGAKDSCRKYEGMIVSLNGLTKGYPTYNDIKRTNEIFHPNCKHTVSPIGDLETLHSSQIEKSSKKIKEFKENKK